MYRVIIELYCWKTAFDFVKAENAVAFMDTAIHSHNESASEGADAFEIWMKYVKEEEGAET